MTRTRIVLAEAGAFQKSENEFTPFADLQRPRATTTSRTGRRPSCRSNSTVNEPSLAIPIATEPFAVTLSAVAVTETERPVRAAAAADGVCINNVPVRSRSPNISGRNLMSPNPSRAQCLERGSAGASPEPPTRRTARPHREQFSLVQT